MGGSLRIGRIAGIDVYLHWTFGLLLVGAFGFFLVGGQPVERAVGGVLLILAVFGCVVLHELGHALAARRYGVPTRDITLYPIGGVARLQRIPERPSQELVVALAGPAVNVVLAALIAGGLATAGQPVRWTGGLSPPGASLWHDLLWVNVVLVAFNLLPAFPMDGGRVLRALLAFRLDYARATQIAAAVGQAMAIGFGILAILPPMNPFLLFVALFVYLGAQQEAHATLMRTVVRGVPVRQAMVTRYTALGPGSTLGEAVEHLLAGGEEDFPVLGVDGQMAGVLTRKRLFQALAERDRATRVYDVMEKAGPAVEAGSPLDAALEAMREAEAPMLPVVQGGRLVGVLTLANVGELLMLAGAVERRTGRRAPLTDVLAPR
ncbi:MAG TPA: site-2 protease family protein [Rubricoccaceae bacterium]|nr:site-2 protease family protein [Rubricoccaceae bacterium]